MEKPKKKQDELLLPNLSITDPADKNIELIEDEPEIYDSDVLEDRHAHLIKYEFNLIEFPFFTKDDKVPEGVIKKYIFNEKDNAYMRLIPSADPLAISRKILQEFDEKIFYAILKLYNTQKREDNRIVTDFYTLIALAKLKYNGKNVLRTKDALHRLKHTKIELNNIFYNAEARKIIKNDNITIEILSELRVMDLQKTLELEEGKDDFKRYFNNRKIDNIIIMKLNDYLLNNIINKGFLYIDSDRLLDIGNSVARKLFVLLKKWHGYEKGKVLSRKSSFLASRIPLSWHPKNIASTINTLKNACEYLKDNAFISEYTFCGNDRNLRLQDSFFEFAFIPTNEFVALESTEQSFHTGQETLQIVAEVNDQMIELTDDQRARIEAICAEKKILAPLVACSLVSEYGIHYDSEYVIYVLKRSLAQTKGDGIAYFKKSIQEGYFKDQYENELHLVKEDPLGDLRVYLVEQLSVRMDKNTLKSFFEPVRITRNENHFYITADETVYIERLRILEDDIRVLLKKKHADAVIHFGE